MNPAYLDPEFAAGSRYGGIVSPPVMLQAGPWRRPSWWAFTSAAECRSSSRRRTRCEFLTEAGYTGIVATNSEFEMERYPKVGDEISSETVFESISDEKKTAMGDGYLRHLDQHLPRSAR